MPIVGTLYQAGPLPFAGLSSRLQASRDTLTDTLAKLEANGVIERRYQGKKAVYALTSLGQLVGIACLPLVKLVSESDLLNLALKKWPMLVVVALGRGATRYNETKAALPGMTARSLAIALRELQSAGMIERTVDAGYPPTPMYVLSDKGQLFFPALDDLCHACEAGTAEVAGAPPSPET